MSRSAARQASTGAPTGRGRAALQRVVEEAASRHGVPGLAVGVVDGARDLVATTGVTSVDHPLPVDDHTLFMIGSTSKTVAATTLMRLVEAGGVSLDDAVTDHLPRFRLADRAATRALRVRHLVTHTGGWDGDIDLDAGWGDDALGRFVEALRSQPQLLPPGRAWSYNNAGFAVAGRIVEQVTGTPFEAAVTELVLRPLGMADSFYSPIDAATRRFAVGHVHRGRRASVVHSWGLSRATAPAGGLASTVRDQLTWARFHLGDGRAAGGARLLRARTMRLMQSDLAPAGTLADSVGVSWLIREVGGVRTVAHGGNVNNVHISTFLMVPERGFAVTVLTNATRGRAASTDIERWVLERFLGVRESLPALLRPQPDLAAYTGTYSSRLSTVEVTASRGRLRLTSRFNIDESTLNDEERVMVRRLLSARPPVLPLALVSEERAVVTSGPGAGTRGEFLREGSPDGRPQWLRWAGRLHRRSS